MDGPAASSCEPLTRAPRSDMTPVWTLSEPPSINKTQQLDDLMRSDVPLEEKCGLEPEKPSGGRVCCKDLKDDDERHLINPAVVRDM